MQSPKLKDGFKIKATAHGVGLEGDFLFCLKIVNVFDEIHNGEFEKPLLFEMGGLVQTKSIFQKLGVSRFHERMVLLIGNYILNYTDFFCKFA